jgi:hypothetical protein
MRVESNARGFVSPENISKSRESRSNARGKQCAGICLARKYFQVPGRTNARGSVSPEIISMSRESRSNARGKQCAGICLARKYFQVPGRTNARGRVSPEIISKSRESRTNARANATRPRRVRISPETDRRSLGVSERFLARRRRTGFNTGSYGKKASNFLVRANRPSGL